MIILMTHSILQKLKMEKIGFKKNSSFDLGSLEY